MLPKKKKSALKILLIQEWRERGIKENDGGDEFNYDIL
jgi:hypothetical protein